MILKFNAYGHPNILGTHKTTIGITKDEEISLKGDCIIGVGADFEASKLKNFVKKSKCNKILITLIGNGIEEKISAELNTGFNDEDDIVIRKTDFLSKRTLAIKASKAAFEISRPLIGYLRQRKSKISLLIENRAD